MVGWGEGGGWGGATPLKGEWGGECKGGVGWGVKGGVGWGWVVVRSQRLKLPLSVNEK